MSILSSPCTGKIQIECTKVRKWLEDVLKLKEGEYKLVKIVEKIGQTDKPPYFVINVSKGNVDLKYFRLNELPDYIQFGEIKNGSFDCSESQLSSAKGFPYTVGKRFNCRDSKITSLDGMPKEVGEHFVWTNSPFTEEEIRSKVKIIGRVYR